ncbi:MAG: RNA polymerase sigma factor [Phycisphaerales bacterium]
MSPVPDQSPAPSPGSPPASDAAPPADEIDLAAAEADDAARADERLQDALSRAATGDESAWRWIIDTYSRRVFGLLYAQCGDPDTAEELTQSAFCTVVAKIGDYTEQGRFEAWLFRIAMNRLRDEMRRRKRHAVPVEDSALAAMAGAADASVDEPDDVLTLRGAVQGLSEPDQRVLQLRHAAGLSFKRIAEILDQPLGTVLARHHRALRKLRDDLGPRFEPGADEADTADDDGGTASGGPAGR